MFSIPDNFYHVIEEQRELFFHRTYLLGEYGQFDNRYYGSLVFGSNNKTYDAQKRGSIRVRRDLSQYGSVTLSNDFTVVNGFVQDISNTGFTLRHCIPGKTSTSAHIHIDKVMVDHVENFYLDGNAALAAKVKARYSRQLKFDSVQFIFRANPYRYYQTLFSSGLKIKMHPTSTHTPQLKLHASFIHKMSRFWVLGARATVKGNDPKSIESDITLSTSYNLEEHKVQFMASTLFNTVNPLKGYQVSGFVQSRVKELKLTPFLYITYKDGDRVPSFGIGIKS